MAEPLVSSSTSESSPGGRAPDIELQLTIREK